MKTNSKRQLKGRIIASTLILSMTLSYGTAFADNGKGKYKNNKDKAHKVVEMKKDKDWKVDKSMSKYKVDKDIDKVLEGIIEIVKTEDLDVEDNEKNELTLPSKDDDNQADNSLEDVEDTTNIVENDEEEEQEYTNLLDDDTIIEIDNSSYRLQRELQKNIEKRDKVIGKILTSKKGLENRGFFGQLLRYTGIINKLETQLKKSDMENELQEEETNEDIITEVEETDTNGDEVTTEAEEKDLKDTDDEDTTQEDQEDQENLSTKDEAVSQVEAVKMAEEIKKETDKLKKQIDEFKDRILALLSKLFKVDVTEGNEADEVLEENNAEEEAEQIIYEVIE